MQPDDAPYLSTEAVARRQRLSRTTLPRTARRGAIAPAFHTPGGALRFRAAAIDAYARQLTNPASSPLGCGQRRPEDRA